MSDWVQGEALHELLRESSAREVWLRFEDGQEALFYVVRLGQDEDGLSLEAHRSFPRWQSVVAWSSCGVALALLLTSPLVVAVGYYLHASPYLLLIYLALPLLYLISMSLFSPRLLISVSTILAGRLKE